MMKSCFSLIFVFARRLPVPGMALGVAAAMLLSTQAARAVPVLGDLQHGWLFDTTVGSNLYSPDMVLSNPVRMASIGLTYGETDTPNYKPVPLVQGGSMVSTGAPDFTGPGPNATQKHALPATGMTPFTYAGNQAVLNDWYINTLASYYPNDKVTTFAVPGDMATNPVHLGTSGSISMWVNPLSHDNAPPSTTTNTNPASVYMLGAIGPAATDRFQVGIGDDNFASVELRQVSQATQFTYVTGAGGAYGWGLADPNTAQDPGYTYNGFPTNDWTNIVVTWGPDSDGAGPLLGGMQIYVDGIARGSNPAFTMTTGFDLTRLSLSRYNNQGVIPMLADELGIWNTKLTQADAQWLTANSMSTLAAAVPEPASVGLLVLGLIGFARFRRKRAIA